MGSMTVKDRFTQIESMLKSIVGAQKTQAMTIDQFTHYAQKEITKAMSEEGAAASRRLKALSDAVRFAKDNFTDDESESLNVPVYVCDSTALDEKSNELMTPAQAAGSSSNTSYFEKSIAEKFAAMQSQMSELMKQFENEDEEKRKKAAATEEEKKKATSTAPSAGPPPPPASSRGDVNEEEEEEPAPDSEDDEQKRKKAAASAKAAGDIEEGDDAMKGKKDKTEKGLKGPDVSSDGTGWPADLNDPAFQKNGTIEKSLEWGKD